MKYTPEYSSRFRILKGEKISLVVSTLLVGSSLMANYIHIINDASSTSYDLLGTNLIDVDTDNYGGGIWAQTLTYSTLSNSGILTVDAIGDAVGYVSGIYAYDTRDNNIITNSGTITINNGQNSRNSAGLLIKGGWNGFDIGNTVIENELGASIIINDLDNPDQGTRQAGILISPVDSIYSSTITNAGSITIDSDRNEPGTATSLYGIRLMYTPNGVLDTTITNSGSIDITSQADGGGHMSYGISSHSLDSGSSILNSGSIDLTNNTDGSSSGIYVYYMKNDANIENSSTGTITVTTNTVGAIAEGICAEYMIDTSSFTNSGTITVTNNGASYTYENNGYYYTRSAVASGMRAYSTFQDSQMTNAGSISVIANGSSALAYGMRVGHVDSYNDEYGYMKNYSSLTNSGTITVTTTGDGEYYYANTRASGMSAAHMYDNSSITNSGTITVETSGDLSLAEGIHVSVMDAYSTITNTTTNGTTDGLICVSSSGAYSDTAGIAVGKMYNESTITNSGAIAVRSTGDYSFATGIYIREGLYEDALIENSGVISVAETGYHDLRITYATGIMVESMDETATISNTGTINATSTYGAGSGIVVRSAADGALITNTGTIKATIDGSIDGNGDLIHGVLHHNAFSINDVDGSGLSVDNNYIDADHYGKLYGNIRAFGTVNNAGLISLPHDAVNAFIGTLNNASTGILEIGVEHDGTDLTHSKLYVNNATFAEGSTISVNVTNATKDSGNERLIAGQTLEDVVFADDTLSVGATLNITDNSTLFDFTYVINGLGNVAGDSTIDLVAASAQSYQERAAAGGGNTGTQSAAAAAEEAGIDFVGIIDGDDIGFAQAVQSTMPVATTAAVTANTQIMNGIQGIVEMRQISVLEGMNSGDLSMADKNLWVKLYGSKGTQDNKDGLNGFDVKSFGLGIGADAEIAPKQRVGLALFYTDAKVDVNNMNQNTDTKVYTVLGYGNVPLNSNTDFLYQAGYTWQKNDSNRVDFFNDRYTADYTAKTASLDLKLMQTYQANNQLTLRPLVETTYRHYTNPDYTENGIGTAGPLSVDEFTSTQLIIGGGLIAEYKTGKNDKLIADIGLGYDLHHDKQTITAEYGSNLGVKFSTNGIDNGGLQYDIGLGYETANILGGELNFMYNYQGQGSSFDNHVLAAKYVWKF